ncbi:hypothetical protein [Halobacillus halophilus]|uniref:hypothetical protein n=1 Tax=Halobacillus halophilus TaxID=1570 RepID=UPI001CD3C77D|nr:hypothetical protein [Halobacillus halophilus]MCA1009565.1 hypothetical protein [Halobacillus halophilus]
MIQMSESQKRKFDHMLSLLKNASSPEEVRYYFTELQQFLDTLHTDEKPHLDQMESKDLEKYKYMLKKMMEASTKKEVLYYEKEVHDLINKISPINY